MLSVRTLSIALVSSALLAGSNAASAQGLGSLRKKAEEAKKKVETAVDKKPSADAATPKSAPAASPASNTSDPAPSTAGAASSNAAAKPSAKVWDNYDFVPGNRVIFYTGFSEDKVGKFRAWGEVRERSGRSVVVRGRCADGPRSTIRQRHLEPAGRVDTGEWAEHGEQLGDDP